VSLLKIFDDRNDIIARIDVDGFWVANTVRKKRPDQSTLVVYDHYDREVLKIHLLNDRAMSLTGIFRLPSSTVPMRITPSSIDIDTNKYMGNTVDRSDIDISMHAQDKNIRVRFGEGMEHCSASKDR
jgi:hypothetical protein